MTVTDEQAPASFSAEFTPGKGPITLVLLPALFVGEWLWEKTWEGLRDAGWPIMRFSESISLIDADTARSIEKIADEVRENVRTHTTGPVIVCGDSLGCLIAFEYARKYKDDVRRHRRQRRARMELKVRSFIKETAEGCTTPREFADKFLAQLVHDPAKHNIDEERYAALVDELAQPENYASIYNAVRAISKYPTIKVVPRLEVEKLFLWGRYDQITPVEPWIRAVPRWKRARLVVFEDCGHAPMFEVPDEFNAELLVFLDHCAKQLPGGGG